MLVQRLEDDHGCNGRLLVRQARSMRAGRGVSKAGLRERDNAVPRCRAQHSRPAASHLITTHPNVQDRAHLAAKIPSPEAQGTCLITV